MELQIGKTVIRILEGDITDFEGDAVVNAANDHLWMGSGVAGAIRRRGGEAIEREAVARGPIPVGGAVETTGGSLAARYVIHAAVMGQDLRTNAEYIRQATISTLEVAERLEVRSIAFPAFGTGVGGFPLAECARLMLGAFSSRFSEGRSCIQEVAVVLCGEEPFGIYKEETERFSGGK